MNWIIPLDDAQPEHTHLTGGKFVALAAMVRHGIRVPPALCIAASAYTAFVTGTRVNDRILFELHRKRFEDMRWEEIWDTSLRIRNVFLRTPLPAEIAEPLADAVESTFGSNPVVVRSSGTDEDSATASFAGMHDSFVNITGTKAILDHVKQVWASLWSDRAILYRQELNLDIEKSTMAVIVQQFIHGECSGLLFGRHPTMSDRSALEAVYGLNQGLVDGVVQPDRWILDRETGTIHSHTPAHRDAALMPAPQGVRQQPIPPPRQNKPPLEERQIRAIFHLSRKIERVFGAPQDIEWTLSGDTIYALQARPITTTDRTDDDGRSWYLTLTRSFENLQALQHTIEQETLPGMENAAGRLAGVDVSLLSDRELADELEGRLEIYEASRTAYWRDCIPFAHGMRLFGQVYNDVVRPMDPFEFTLLLENKNLLSLKRNRMLEQMAQIIRGLPVLTGFRDRYSHLMENERLKSLVDSYKAQFHELIGHAEDGEDQDDAWKQILDVATRLAAREPSMVHASSQDTAALRDRFFSQFEGERRAFAEELLELARASYRLRDDDNIYLGRVKKEVTRARNEAMQRLLRRGIGYAESLTTEELTACLHDARYRPARPAESIERHSREVRHVFARQLTGQPASPGIAKGEARVVQSPADLSQFQGGEVLVCDAVSPEMTFVVPLAAAIVERRGGMLIHGAIIAREYGIPCVTGVPDVGSFVQTGKRLTVDGYLGVVIVS